MEKKKGPGKTGALLCELCPEELGRGEGVASGQVKH